MKTKYSVLTKSDCTIAAAEDGLVTYSLLRSNNKSVTFHCNVPRARESREITQWNRTAGVQIR